MSAQYALQKLHSMLPTCMVCCCGPPSCGVKQIPYRMGCQKQTCANCDTSAVWDFFVLSSLCSVCCGITCSTGCMLAVSHIYHKRNMGVLTPPEHNCDVAAKSFGDTKLTGLWLSGNEFRLQELGKGSREELKEFHVQRIRDQRGPQLSQRQVGQGSQFVSATATVGAIGPVLVQMLCVGKPDVKAPTTSTLNPFRTAVLCRSCSPWPSVALVSF